MRGTIILAAIIIKDAIAPITVPQGKFLGIILGVALVIDIIEYMNKKK